MSFYELVSVWLALDLSLKIQQVHVARGVTSLTGLAKKKKHIVIILGIHGSLSCFIF
jgi:hypothetical protein